MFSRFKFQIIGAALIAVLMGGGLAYLNHQKNTIESLRNQNTTLSTQNISLRSQIENQAKSHKEEIQRWQNSVDEYATQVKENQRRVTSLRTQLNAIQNEKTKECLAIELPGSIADSLFRND